MNDDYKDVSGLLEEDVSKAEGGTDMKVDTDEKISVISVSDKIGIGDKIEIIKPIVPIKPIRAPKLAAMRTMAEYSIPTPVTRKEMYLNVIAGGVSALPTPITREEIYLAKICGMDVAIPIPLTRYEMYLYKLAGGEWEVPEPVTRLEIFLYHNCGYEIEVPEPITREEIYWNGGQPQPTTIEGVPPLTFTAKRTGALVDYRIDGNSVQSGTPTPDSPIEPEFCGDLVSIELDEPLRAVGDYKDTLDLGTKTYTKRIQEYVITGEEGVAYYGSSDIWYVRADVSTLLSLSSHYQRVSNLYSLTQTDFAYQTVPSGYKLRLHDSRFETAADCKAWLAQQYANNTPVKVWYVLAEPIITTLSSIPDGMTGTIEGTVYQSGTPTPDNPIEPVFNGTLLPNGKYQVYKTYKIPISSGGVTKNIYLGQVPTTRRIKKLVLTGNEDITLYIANSERGARIQHVLDTIHTREPGFCNIYPVDVRPGTVECLWIGMSGAGNDNVYFVSILDVMGLTTKEDFKAYLAQQYAAGTPVTVWYILATPETGIVNEPLAKIGDYADSITFEQAGVEIPVTAGTNTLSVGTEIQPSNMMISYK